MIPTKTLGSGTSAVRRIMAGGIIAVTLVACGGGSRAGVTPSTGRSCSAGKHLLRTAAHLAATAAMLS